jgi:hypothetical protein
MRLPLGFDTDVRDDHGLAYHRAAKALVMLDGRRGARGVLAASVLRVGAGFVRPAPPEAPVFAAGLGFRAQWPGPSRWRGVARRSSIRRNPGPSRFARPVRPRMIGKRTSAPMRPGQFPVIGSDLER